MNQQASKQKTIQTQYQKMTETPIPKLIIMLGIPTTISMLVTNIYNMADTYFVSQLGTSASGAVGIVFGLMSILQAFGFMIGQGSGSIISRSLGAKDGQTANRIASKGFFSSLASGIMIGVLGILFLDPLMRLLGSTETILPYARTYALFILITAPLMTASFTMNNMLRYEGRASFAMIGLTAGGILNIFGDWFLMMELDLGIAGAGLSTAISQAISFCLLLFMYLSGKTQSKIKLRLCFEKPEHVAENASSSDLLKITKTGFPSLIRQGLSSVATMLLNGQAGLYGDAAVAAMAIVGRVCFFVYAVAIGIGQGFQPVSAFNYGAKKYSRVKKGFFFTVLAGEVTLGVMAILGILLSGHVIGFFRDDPEVIAVGTFALRVQLVALLFQPMMIATNMMFQSIGKSKVATFLSALRSGLVFIPMLLLLANTLGLIGIQTAQPVADMLSLVIALPFAAKFLKNLPVDE